MEYDYQTLLSNVASINRGYKKIAEITGENFNIFSVLKLETDEVRAHSRFVAELLNPKGSHGQKDMFLKLFMATLEKKFEVPFTLNTNNPKVEVEKYIGMISDDKTTGGRIDIIISDGVNKRLTIENKIEAGDQENQLLRYYNFDKESIIFYLNKYGSPPKETVPEALQSGKNFFLLSYNEDIIEWLENCKEKTSNYPLLRETITQYIYLLKKLTHQTKYIEMSKEIIDVITTSKSNFEASMLISNEFLNAKKNVLDDFWEDVKTDLLLKLGSNFNGNIWISAAMNQPNPALFIKIDDKKLVGMEPLNGQHFKSRFNELFIGVIDHSYPSNNPNSPYPHWHKCEKMGLDFSDINGSLGDILPNSSKRGEIKDEIIKEIISYINKLSKVNEASVSNNL